jgi:hypothetical protein
MTMKLALIGVVIVMAACGGGTKTTESEHEKRDLSGQVRQEIMSSVPEELKKDAAKIGYGAAITNLKTECHKSSYAENYGCRARWTDSAHGVSVDEQVALSASCPELKCEIRKVDKPTIVATHCSGAAAPVCEAVKRGEG